MKKKIAYLGKDGSYSYLFACAFEKNATYVGRESFRSVIQMVKKGNVDLGVIPIENSTTGSIYEVYDLLIEENVQIIDEGILKVNHVLLVKPKTSEKNIETCYCHPEAYKQCSEVLVKKRIKPVFVEDSATAVEKLKKDTNNKACAIGNNYLKKKFGVKIISENIQNQKSNYTRFVVITKEKTENKSADKATVIFSVKHTPGSLLKALKPYAEYGLNLTKIESRPIDGKPWEYVFIVDFLIKTQEDLKKVVTGMKKHSEYVTVLGTYKKGKTYGS